jgi:glycosyltransferase involved in cell wall biosynthesis
MGETPQQVPFFSIVMPVYAVEAYVEEAIKSIRIQTYANWELIVVNDCTKDRSAIIAEKYASKDHRIKVVHHRVNQGASGAYNTGIRVAKGQYLWFVDSKDRVEIDLLEHVYQSLQRQDAQAVMFGHVEESYNREGVLEYERTISLREQYFTNADALRSHVLEYEQKGVYAPMWNKMYQLEYLRTLGMKVESVRENANLFFNVIYFQNMETLNVLPNVLYHHANRVTEKENPVFVLEHFDLDKKRIEVLFEQFQSWGICSRQVRSTLGRLYARYLLAALERNSDRRAKMNYARRSRWCRMIFGQRMFQELIPFAEEKERRSLQLAIRVLQSEKPLPCLLMGRIEHLARVWSPMYDEQERMMY